MINIAIFASGSGSNAENICRYFKNSKQIRVTLIISNKKESYVLKRAESLLVESAVFIKSDFETSGKVVDCLQNQKIDFIVLAGFLLKVPDNLLEAYPNRIINIHPALLPKYGGKGMYGVYVHKAVKEAGETESGITIHYVNENYDEGNIIYQAKCAIQADDTPDDIANKVHALEYKYYPEVIESVVKTQFRLT